MKSLSTAFLWTGIVVILCIIVAASCTTEVAVYNEVPDCPVVMIYDAGINACIPLDLIDGVEIGEEFDFMLTITDCATEEKIDAHVLTVLAIGGYEQEIEKLLNQPVGIYVIKNLIMGDIYFIDIVRGGYLPKRGEFQITQVTDEICIVEELAPDEPLFLEFQQCVEENTMAMCCLAYLEIEFDFICSR